uniref:Uncharacterized protein n=1 Tax=Siphoviridae sp. ctNHg2 TaxID=2825467 RepID=A0A8S5V4I6_9CAUD|nr:MAG TPA: hypothetical protein [Siphoviridae sp. ctNHg2]
MLLCMVEQAKRNSFQILLLISELSSPKSD